MSELQIDTQEIANAIRSRLEGFTPSLTSGQVGRIIEVGDGIARVAGLPNAAVNELLEFEGGSVGLALNLDEESIGAVILGDVEHIEEGQAVKATGRILSMPVGDAVLGRVLNALGEPIDGKGAITGGQLRRMEIQAPGITGRKPVHEPLQTGIKAIDAMTPIGRGQRELIIGDRKTGKTTVAIDTTRRAPPSPRRSRRSRASAPWSTPSSSPRPRRTPRRSSTSRRTRVAPSASTGWRTASTR
jgi:F-type H+-transporting ATPase subunit alpha